MVIKNKKMDSDNAKDYGIFLLKYAKLSTDWICFQMRLPNYSGMTSDNSKARVLMVHAYTGTRTFSKVAGVARECPKPQTMTQ